MRAKRITLRDVAMQAGVSVMTASRALRPDTEISQAMRQRIEAVAVKLGYRPDPALTALVAHRHQLRVRKLHAVIALVWVVEPHGPPPGPRPAGIAKALAERARRLGYVVATVKSTPDEASLRQTAADLEARGVRGVILYRPHALVDDLPFVWDRFACVRISGKPSLTGIHNVMINNVQGMTLLADELIRRGYQRPGLVYTSEVSVRSTHQWPCAYSLVPMRLPEACPHPLPLSQGLDEQMGVECLGQWIRKHSLDCVIFAEEAWLLSWIKKAGFRVPQDIGFCSLHADESTASGLTRIELMGHVVVDLLNSAMQANDLGLSPDSSNVQLPMRWQEGTTLRPARTAMA